MMEEGREKAKLVCDCSINNSCTWISRRPFKCLGPCRQPVKWIKQKKHYVKLKRIFHLPHLNYTASQLQIRIKQTFLITQLQNWTVALVFNKQINGTFHSGETDITVSKNQRVVSFTPKTFLRSLKDEPEYRFTVFIERVNWKEFRYNDCKLLSLLHVRLVFCYCTFVKFRLYGDV